MARAFWAELAAHVDLEIEVLPNYKTQRAPYPKRFRILPVDWNGSPVAPNFVDCALLVGDTPVTADLGLGWPLRFLAVRLDAIRERGIRVDAVGVGVDRLHSSDARDLFERHYRAAIESWSVRSEACRESLLELQIPSENIIVGADWAWVYRPQKDTRSWARKAWISSGVDPDSPLLVVNAVNERWSEASEFQETVAKALDEIHEVESLQVAFFCQESRSGEFFDHEAALRVMRFMRSPAVLVPNKYYSPDELLGLLSYASATLSQRYHYTIASVLAGTVPINLLRGQKMKGLVRELGLPDAGLMGNTTVELLVERTRETLRNRSEWIRQLKTARTRLEARARKNLFFVQERLGS